MTSDYVMGKSRRRYESSNSDVETKSKRRKYDNYQHEADYYRLVKFHMLFLSYKILWNHLVTINFFFLIYELI